LPNILVFENGNIKISDFSLAKETRVEQGEKWRSRRTPVIMSPEAVNDSVYESPTDIWALGCAIVEMVTGESAWNVSDMLMLTIRIGVGEELPKIPDELLREGIDFLEKCFVKDPLRRWTIDLLLKHPFISDVENVSVVTELS
jgi:serine/threonine protein kinase